MHQEADYAQAYKDDMDAFSSLDRLTPEQKEVLHEDMKKIIEIADLSNSQFQRVLNEKKRKKVLMLYQILDEEAQATGSRISLDIDDERMVADGIRFPVGRLFEDEFTTYKLYYHAAKTVFCGDTLYYYFVNDNGITRNLTMDKRFDEYDAQWERIKFFQEYGLDTLLGKAALTFLETAQWDRIACRNESQTVNPEKKTRFENQYAAAFQIAKEQRVLEFIRDYDYYVLAKPSMTLLWWIRRQIQLLFKKV